MRKDVTNCPRIHSEDRGVNTKEWILCDNKKALFKETQLKPNTDISTYADYAEAIVTDVCKLLDVSCQDTELVTRNGKDGCLCYSFLRPKIDELRDIGTVIQGVRSDFNSKSMFSPSTRESYCIEMIIEGMEAFCRTRKESAAARKELIEQILVDSLIDHYDRNPSNLSMVVNPENISLSPKYDNGTSLSMSVPIEILKGYLNNEGTNVEKHDVVRSGVNSKLGYLGLKYVKYEDLETYIFNYYYDDTKEIVEKIRENITEESIDKLLSNEKYANLSDVHKNIVKMKLLANKERMVERSNQISKKVQIDSIIFNRNARQNFTNNVEKGVISEIIPEYSKCLGKPITDPDYEGTMDDLIPGKIQNIVDIQELSRYFKIPIETLTKREKNLLKWVTIIESIEKSDPDSKPFETITSRLGFVREDKELIHKLIQDKFKDETDHVEARELIYGKTGIGAENINLYIAKKFIDSTVMKREVRDQRMDELRTYAQTMYETKEYNDLISVKSSVFKSRNFQNAGIKDQDKLVIAQIILAKFLSRNPRATTKEWQGVLQETANELLGNVQEKIADGIYVDRQEAKTIRDHAFTLDNGQKIVIFNTPEGLQNTAFRMGMDYYGQIIKHPSGNGVTTNLLSKKGLKFPEAFDAYAKEFLSQNLEKYGKKSVVYRPDNCGKSSSCFYVSSIGNNGARIPDVTESEFKDQIIELFNNRFLDKKSNKKNLDDDGQTH